MDIIAQSLEYYDNNNNNYKKLKDKITYINIIKTSNDNFIEFYDENKKLLKKSKYEILGTYNYPGNIWTWGWSVALLNKRLANTSKKIFNYGFDLDENNVFIRNELITSRFKITNPIQLDIHIAIGSYLSKKDFIFSYKQYSSNILKKSYEVIDDIEVLNIKKKYENKPYIENYFIILD